MAELCRAMVAEADRRAENEEANPDALRPAAEALLAQLGAEGLLGGAEAEEVVKAVADAGLDAECLAVLRRTMELAQQRVKESQETFAFGGGSESDSEASDHAEAAEEAKAENPKAEEPEQDRSKSDEAEPAELPAGKSTKCCELM